MPEPSLLDWLDPDLGSTGVLDCYPMIPPSGYVAEDLDTLGPFGVFTLLVALGARTVDVAFEQMPSWRNDWLVTFRPADEPDRASVAAAWRVRFASPDDARVFAEGLEWRLPGRTQLTIAGAEVLLLAASDDHVSDTWSMDECLERADVPLDWAAAAGL